MKVFLWLVSIYRNTSNNFVRSFMIYWDIQVKKKCLSVSVNLTESGCLSHRYFYIALTFATYLFTFSVSCFLLFSKSSPFLSFYFFFARICCLLLCFFLPNNCLTLSVTLSITNCQSANIIHFHPPSSFWLSKPTPLLLSGLSSNFFPERSACFNRCPHYMFQPFYFSIIYVDMGWGWGVYLRALSYQKAI